jgi:hypothetical protein
MFIHEIHPSIKSVQVMPYAMAKIISSITGNRKMNEGAELMEFIEKVGEKDSPRETFETIGKPEITLEDWIHMQN